VEVFPSQEECKSSHLPGEDRLVSSMEEVCECNVVAVKTKDFSDRSGLVELFHLVFQYLLGIVFCQREKVS
jgi:hypothetical protein